jgi:hypothetical protein
MARIRIEDLPIEDKNLGENDLKSVIGAGLVSAHSVEATRQLFADDKPQRSANPFLKDVDPEDLLD